MKRIGYVLFFLCLLPISACEPSEVEKGQSEDSTSLPEGLPGYVKEKDFEQIDWKKEARPFQASTGEDMVGIQDKLGIIGPELEAGKIQKWLWLFWGIDQGEVTFVGYNQRTSNISSVLHDGVWSFDVKGGGMYGADASMPSNVRLPEEGKWALIVYLDGKWFETLIVDVKR